MPTKPKVKKAATSKKKASPKKNTKKVSKKQTHIALVIDRSGSMEGVRKAAFQGINEQIKAIRTNAKKGGETKFTYVQFDGEIDVIHHQVDASKLKNIEWEQYEPRGCTALRDGLWTAIQKLEEGVKETDDTAYLVIVVTDGYENASQLINQKELKDEIDAREKTGKWTFTYMLSNVDWKTIQDQFGVSSVSNIAVYTSTPTGLGAAMNSVGQKIDAYYTARSAGQTYTANFHNAADNAIDDLTEKSASKIITLNNKTI
jgi:uncharacterized protein YegL